MRDGIREGGRDGVWMEERQREGGFSEVLIEYENNQPSDGNIMSLGYSIILNNTIHNDWTI